MPLATMKWATVSVHTVVAAFLQSERQKIQDIETDPSQLNHLCEIIDNPDLTNPAENHTRLRTLYRIRGRLFGEIPPDTKWYEVSHLTDQELIQLHVIARCGFAASEDNTNLLNDAARQPRHLTTSPVNWNGVTLWGHSKNGPFTIIEGNHRLTAYASTSSGAGLKIPVFVGLSTTPCFWHHSDPRQILLNDLWR